MALKTGIFSLALGALLLGSTGSGGRQQQFQAQQDFGDTQVAGPGLPRRTRRDDRRDDRWNDQDRRYGRPV